MLKTSSFFPNQTSGWQKIILNFTTTSGGENTLYLGALNEASSLLNIPSPQNLFGCNYGNYNNPSTTYYGSGYFIDNVKLIALNDGTINLPSSICSNENLSNLESYLNAIQPNGVFTGNGIINNSGIYSFNAATVGVGLHTITYTYTNSSNCSVSIYHNIDVTNCTPPPCPPSLAFNSTEGSTSATYHAVNTIVTSNNYIVNAGSTITLLAGSSITLSASSHIKANSSSSFTAKIEACNQISGRVSNNEISKDELITDKTVKFFPNPTKESITISATNCHLKKVTIYSIEGKIVYSQDVEKSNSLQLNLANYQNGIYLAIAEDEEGKIYREKIIKN
jgi:hypothetical protein